MARLREEVLIVPNEGTVETNKDYFYTIQKQSEILEILESYNDPLIDLQIENATLEYKSNQEENDGEEYKYGDRFHT